MMQKTFTVTFTGKMIPDVKSVEALLREEMKNHFGVEAPEVNVKEKK